MGGRGASSGMKKAEKTSSSIVSAQKAVKGDIVWLDSAWGEQKLMEKHGGLPPLGGSYSGEELGANRYRVSAVTDKALQVDTMMGKFWLPKSNFSNNPEASLRAWNSVPHEKRAFKMPEFHNNKYDGLISQAKKAGITGIRSRMKVSSIVQKAQSQGKFDAISGLVEGRGNNYRLKR